MVTINGKTYHGNNIVVRNGVVTIDGVAVDGEHKNGILEIKVGGDLCQLKSDLSVSVNGQVSGDVTAGGSVNCGNVVGDVSAGGSVHCGRVGGDLTAGGSVVHQ